VQAALRTSTVNDRAWANAGLRIDDDTQRAPTAPHPLERRCGGEIHQRLLGCSLYRPELDLSVRNTAGEVVAYCICWADFKNRFAMLEPMRTEQAWQGRGLGTALIAEQVRRLRGLGIDDLRVNYATNNRAAQRLYAKSKFVLRFKRVAYRWSPPASAASG
jgi:GNAT superfamily N-acetyltransferase